MSMDVRPGVGGEGGVRPPGAGLLPRGCHTRSGDAAGEGRAGGGRSWGCAAASSSGASSMAECGGVVGRDTLSLRGTGDGRGGVREKARVCFC